MEIDSHDYHHYVIRDGKLIGEFEQMYRHSENVPWHQDEQSEWIDVRITIQLLKDLAPFDEIHDLGCGLGYYLDLLHRHIGSRSAFGYDISPTACEKARAHFPDFHFTVIDLTKPCEPPQEQTQVRRLFVIRATLWYVFPHIAQVIQNIHNLMNADDRLLIVQNFPPLDKPFVGKDVIPDHHSLMRHFERAFVMQRHLWYVDALRVANDNWFIGVFTRRNTSR